MKNVLTCFVLLTMLYGCKNGTSGSPKHTVQSFIDASRDGNLTEVKKYISKSDVSMMEMGEAFLSKLDPDGAKGMKDKMMKEFKDKTKDAKVVVKDEKIDGENATVNVEFASAGKSETRPFNLVKEEGQWKISLISTGMKNSGSDQQEVQETMKKMNMDSLQDALTKGMEEFNKLDKDSLKKVMKEGIESGMKEMEKIKDSIHKN